MEKLHLKSVAAVRCSSGMRIIVLTICGSQFVSFPFSLHVLVGMIVQCEKEIYEHPSVGLVMCENTLSVPVLKRLCGKLHSIQLLRFAKSELCSE